MKTTTLLFVLVLASCTYSDPTEYDSKSNQVEIDTLVEKSKKGVASALKVGSRCDSITKSRIVKTVETLRDLKEEVVKYQVEKMRLMDEIKFKTEKVIYKVDTVYVETKTNFWGKQKTKTSVVESVDSTLTTSTENIDTTNHH